MSLDDSAERNVGWESRSSPNAVIARRQRHTCGDSNWRRKGSGESVEKNSTGISGRFVNLANDLPGLIISVQKSIRKGLFFEAVIRGRILSIMYIVSEVWHGC